MGVEWTVVCSTCREFCWLGSMKPWKWSGFQVDLDSVREWFSLHARPACSILIDVNSARVDEGITLDPEDGWSEDLRSRRFWESYSTSTKPPRMHCAECNKWLAVVEDDRAPRLIDASARPIVIGSYLWLCDERCLTAFARRPGRVWRRAVPRRAGESLRVGCAACASEVDADKIEPLEMAAWLTEHLGPECALAARIDRG
jgi:hypothetical protein